jgi:AcrR family transcriptional regulator
MAGGMNGSSSLMRVPQKCGSGHPVCQTAVRAPGAGGVGQNRGMGPDGTVTAGAARGRPRSERVRLAVLDAAADLLIEGGMAAATMEGIAARAGVSKATIYKWWPSRGQLALDSFFNRTRDSITVDEDAALPDALASLLDRLCALFRDTPSGALMRELISVGQSDPDVRAALEERWLRPRRAITRALLTGAVGTGELPADLDVEVALDQLFGPIYHRLIFGHQPLGPGLGATLVRQALPGLR